MVAISAVNISKKYGEKNAVNHVNLHVPKGIIYGFLGRNGAGKSTLINIISGIIHQTEGDIQILGSEDRNLVLARMGVLPDYTALYESWDALQHLHYFSNIQGKMRTKDECLHVLDQVGLLGDAKVKVGGFSFGMKKKLGIAQAIVNKPELLILDEPTSGLDAESTIKIQRILLELNKKGTTIFMTSHNLGEIEKICTRIAIMKDGAIVNEGTLSELQAKYTHTLHVTMEVDQVPDDKLLAAARKLTGPIDSGSKTLYFSASSKTIIGKVVTLFAKSGISVQHVSSDRPNLQDIFLEE